MIVGGGSDNLEGGDNVWSESVNYTRWQIDNPLYIGDIAGDLRVRHRAPLPPGHTL
jgi:hypothetical protein